MLWGLSSHTHTLVTGGDASADVMQISSTMPTAPRRRVEQSIMLAQRLLKVGVS